MGEILQTDKEPRVLPLGTLQRESREVALLRSDVDAYLSRLEEQGCVKGTIAYYRRALNKFAEDLPGNKEIRRYTVQTWREGMLRDGYAPRTINSFVTVINGFLEFIGAREYQLLDRVEQNKELQPELSRAEYLRLLSVAKVLEDERGYLLIKLFATTGILLQELPKVTVEAVSAGKMVISSRGDKRIVHVPEALRAELLAYARSNMIIEGPIFVTHANTPLSRSNVTGIIQKLCADANIPTEKVTPRSLKKLYQTTMSGIEANISVLIKQAYDQLLDEEQLEIGWEE